MRLPLVAALAASSAVGCSSSPLSDAVWPGDAWEVATPAELGLDEGVLEGAREYAFAEGKETQAVVVVRHGRRYETVYAHNRRFRVRKGARVRKGDVIAEVGETGNASAPHLHFEVRRDDDPRDPLLFLP